MQTDLIPRGKLRDEQSFSLSSTAAAAAAIKSRKKMEEEGKK